MVPASRPPMLAMSANGLSSCFSYSSQSGSCQARSPAISPALSSSAASGSWLLSSPVACFPRATTQAPVSVAMSITAAGSNCSLYVRASHNIRRPSASVFNTSMVWPDMLVKISPGFVAVPLGMFSTAGVRPTRLTGSPIPATAATAPNTDAAPHMSNFISSIADEGLMEIPPVSNVTPFPTRTTGLSSSPAPWYRKTISFAGRALPCDTDSREFMPRSFISSSSSTFTSTAGNCLPSSTA